MSINEGKEGSILYLVGLSLVAAIGGLLFGYDTAVISGAIGFLQTHFSLSPALKGWATSSALLGCILGVSITGILSDKFGRKKALIFSALLFLISAIGSALPRNMTEFIIYRIIGGIGVGCASMTSPMYIAEISPARIRGRMVSINQFAIIFGMLIVYFVNHHIAGQGDQTWNITLGWRWMFGSESIPAALFLLFAFFIPESPRWLLKQGQQKKALSILNHIGGEKHAAKVLAEITGTLKHEKSTLAQLFEPGMKIVIFIGVMLAILQQVTGINVVLYYAPEIFKSMGYGIKAALFQTILVGAVNLSFTIIAIWTVDKIGRKPLLLIGASGMGVCMFVIGLASYFRATNAWVLVFILGYIAFFALSLGPVVWVILSEIFPTRIRGRAMSIATFFLWVSCFLISQTFPMLHDNKYLVETFHHGFSFWLYGLMCVLTILFVWKYVPETKGKTLENIEQMWKSKS